MSNGLLFLSLSFCKNNRGETMMCSLSLSLSLSFFLWCFFDALSLSESPLAAKERKRLQRVENGEKK